MSQYQRLLKFASNQPWALKTEMMAILADILRVRASGNRLTDDEIQARIKTHGSVHPNAHTQQYYDPEGDEIYSPRYDENGHMVGYRAESGAPMQNGRNTVAILNVFGVIMQRADQFSEMSGAASIEGLDKRFTAARDDASVSAIVLRFDSPGGGVYGVEELGKTIYEARNVKPIYGSADAEACSAAYWLFGACATRSVTPSGGVGSLGVYSLHQDISKFLETEGIKYEFISAGKYKTEGNPFEPLTEEARAYMQQRVDEYYDAFVKWTAKFYGVSVAKVKADFGQGRVLGAEQAKEAGMVDRVEPFAETLRRAGKAKVPAGTKADAIVNPAAYAELNAAQIEIDGLNHGQR